MLRVCHAFLSVHCSLVVTCWERTGLLALLCVVFWCVCAVFPCGGLGRVLCLIVSIPDICHLTIFVIAKRTLCAVKASYAIFLAHCSSLSAKGSNSYMFNQYELLAVKN